MKVFENRLIVYPFVILLIAGAVFVGRTYLFESKEHVHGADCSRDHDHDAHAHAPGERCTDDHAAGKEAEDAAISETALKNYGVSFMTLKKEDYTPYTVIPAKIDQMPSTDWVFAMPLGGQINLIYVKPGEAVRPGQPLVRILRDPIARPELVFTGNFLRPEVKMLRESASEFSKTTRVLANLKRELKRLKDAQTTTNAGNLIPKKDIIDLENQVAEQEVAENGQRHALRAFGYSETELDQLATGVFIVPNTGNWIEALKINGYWGEDADRLLALLPETVRQHYWTVAGIGELRAMGLFTDEVLTAVEGSNALRHGWTDVASLLIQGYSIHVISQWAEQGWLKPVVEVALPANLAASGYDVEEIAAKQGQHLDAGAEILTVVDHAEMVIRCTPIGSELKLLNEALVGNAPLSAVPVIQGTGLPVKNLAVQGFVSDEFGENTAIIPVKNELMKAHEEGSRTPRIWGLRRGMKYLLQVPSAAVLKDVYVVPNGAVTDFGSEKIVIVKHSDHYDVRKVVVIRQDGDRSILSAESELKPGETIAASGAFRLNLALQRGGPEAIDPHAGHNH